MYRPIAANGWLLGAMSAGGPAFAQVSCTVNYTCSYSHCAASIGGYNVTKGPFSFASESACLSPARQQMTRATCSCRAGSATSSANQSPEAAAVDAMNSVIRSGNFATANNATMTMGAGIATGVELDERAVACAADELLRDGDRRACLTAGMAQRPIRNQLDLAVDSLVRLAA